MIKREYDSELTDFGTWWHDNSDRLFHFWVYKKMFTPYEEDQKFMDETPYEDSYAEYGYIREAVELPDGDIFLGFQRSEESPIDYYKLSEIRLSYSERDKDSWLDGACDEDCDEDWRS